MSIQELARDCAQLFASSDILQLESKALIAGLEAQKIRFKVWAGNLGVFAYERAFADFRLRNDPIPRGLLTSLLTQLAKKLRMFSDTSEITTFEPLVLESEAEISDSGSSIASLVIEEETDSEEESREAEARKLHSKTCWPRFGDHQFVVGGSLSLGEYLPGNVNGDNNVLIRVTGLRSHAIIPFSYRLLIVFYALTLDPVCWGSAAEA
ncbi:hypothetical protein BJX62DRAFT_236114 [Aspergillus germanicus]